MSDLFLMFECMSDDEQWALWEEEAAQLEVTMDYYLQEFLI
jgi:hypothetical protein